MLALGLGVPVANKALVLAMVGVQKMMSGSDGFWMILILAQIGMLGAGRWSFDDRIYATLVDWMKPSHGTGNIGQLATRCHRRCRVWRYRLCGKAATLAGPFDAYRPA